MSDFVEVLALLLTDKHERADWSSKQVNQKFAQGFANQPTELATRNPRMLFFFLNRHFGSLFPTAMYVLVGWNWCYKR